MSSTACACRSERSNGLAISLALASSAESAPRIVLITCVQHVDRLEQAFEDVGALLRLLQVELGCGGG